jgi:hypothetical protein
MSPLESGAELCRVLLCALTLKPVRLHILQGFFLADAHTLGFPVAKLTFVRKTEVVGKGH